MTVTRPDVLSVVLVQPDAWSAEGERNLAAARRGLRDLPLDSSYVVVLPELVGATMPRAAYEDAISELAAETGAWVVGGSSYAAEGPMVNGGVVADPSGTIVDHYEKRNPYGVEHDHGVQAGEQVATFSVSGRLVTVLLCADAWFAELLLESTPTAAEVIVVPSFTITRRPPAFSQALWQHLAVARAYEFSAYVAIADWRQPATYHGQPTAGVSGVADPFPREPDGYFTRATDALVSMHHLDLARLDRLRDDRLARRFSRTTPE
jgi:predicted amidohydrolase